MTSHGSIWGVYHAVVRGLGRFGPDALFYASLGFTSVVLHLMGARTMVTAAVPIVLAGLYNLRCIQRDRHTLNMKKLSLQETQKMIGDPVRRKARSRLKEPVPHIALGLPADSDVKGPNNV